MKRKDEKFIGKQLSTLSEHVPDGNEREPSAELDFRTHTLAHAYAVPKKEKMQKNKRKRFWACFAPSATAILCTVLCCVFLIPQKSSPSNTDPEFYYDIDLTSSPITYTELTDKFEVLLPDIDLIASSCLIQNYKKNNKAIYTTMTLHTVDGNITLNVVFVKNYTLINNSRYENLPEKGATDTLEYEYRVIPEAGKAFCKFEYDGYRYYIDYTSEYPEDITYIMTTLTMR